MRDFTWKILIKTEVFNEDETCDYAITWWRHWSGLICGFSNAIQAAGPAVMIAYLLAGVILCVVMHGVGQIILHQKENTVGLAGLISPYVGKRFAHFTDWVYWSLWMAVMVAESAAIAQF